MAGLYHYRRYRESHHSCQLIPEDSPRFLVAQTLLSNYRTTLIFEEASEGVHIHLIKEPLQAVSVIGISVLPIYTAGLKEMSNFFCATK